MDVLENMERGIVKLSESIAKITEGINITALSETLKLVGEYFQNIPDDIKKTQFFGKVQKLQKINLRYDDVVWLVDEFGLSYTEENWRKLSGNASFKSDLYRYIVKIILSTSIEKREKLTILLAHMEPLIYDILEIAKGAKNRLKQDVQQMTVKENKGMSVESLGKVYVLAVMYIVFANTDSYTEEIDNRMPFRNNILHNGITDYSEEDIDVAYELLVDLIEILIRVKE